MRRQKFRTILLVFGVILTSVLTTAGLLVVYNIQEDRERVLLVCEQVAELREDILMYITSNQVPDPNSDEFRPVKCP